MEMFLSVFVLACSVKVKLRHFYLATPYCETVSMFENYIIIILKFSIVYGYKISLFSLFWFVVEVQSVKLSNTKNKIWQSSSCT